MEIINKRDIMSTSEDPNPSNQERKLNLKKALNKFYPEEDLESITDALIFAVDKDLIENKEIPLNAQIKEDILMV
jgi:hypothetical protein